MSCLQPGVSYSKYYPCSVTESTTVCLKVILFKCSKHAEFYLIYLLIYRDTVQLETHNANYLSTTNNVEQSSWGPTQHVTTLQHFSDCKASACASVNDNRSHTSAARDIQVCSVSCGTLKIKFTVHRVLHSITP